MVMSIAFTLLLLALTAIQPSSSLALSQPSDTIFNQTDNQGKKQGFWKKRYPNGRVAYQGYFLDNKPRGTFLRYHENGIVRAKLVFSACGDSATATLYSPLGREAARGEYYRTRKNGKWSYYNAAQQLVLTEEYVHGQRHGISQSFYPNGAVYEQVFWRNEQRHGPTIQYHDNGVIKASAGFDEGVQHGPIRVYYYAGGLRMEGHYNRGLKDGEWRIFSPQGAEISKTTYQQGVASNEEEMLRQASQELEQLLKNAGRINEPSIEDFVGSSGF